VAIAWQTLYQSDMLWFKFTLGLMVFELVSILFANLFQIMVMNMLWFKFVLGLMFFELVSVLFFIVPHYGKEYTTKENKN